MKKKVNTKLYEWQERCKSGTEKCTKCPEKRHLTVDHIVPVNILEQLGLDKTEILYNMDSNFEILCRYCNSLKAGRIDVRNKKTYSILYNVLKKAEIYYIADL